jgi:hypothetical protein
MKRNILVLLALLIFHGSYGNVSEAAVPRLIRYQGTLTDANNVPLEGSYDLKFRIYSAAAGGSPLWTETQAGISIASGVFSVLLGNVAALDLPFDADYWLSTEVGTSGEMLPRQRITSVGYAIRAETADNLAVPPAAPQAVQAVGVISGPSAPPDDWTVIPDMSVTMTTGANTVLVLFSGTFYNDNPFAAGYFTLYIDDTVIPEARRNLVLGNSSIVSINWLKTMAAGTHTFKIKWLTNAGVLRSPGVERVLQVIELK